MQIAADNTKFILAGISISIAVGAFLLLKFANFGNKGKIGLIYAHLLGLFYPISLFTTNAACGFLCLSCFEGAASLAILALPSAFVLSTIAGFIVIPLYFFMSSRSHEIRDVHIRKFIESHSKNLNIRPPKIYAVSSPKPFAFSFRSFSSAIVLSVGLMDILRKKELQAVLLHELAHIQNKASVFKLSTFLMRFSPFMVFKTFSKELTEEEAMADSHACRIQGTHKYLESAKKKISDYERSQQKGGPKAPAIRRAKW